MLRVTSSNDERREHHRNLEIERRKKKRRELLESKRRRNEDEKEDAGRKYTVEQVRELSVTFHKGPAEERRAKMKTLRQMMAQDVMLIDAFISDNNALQALIGQLTGNDSSVQVEAAWCIANITAGTKHHGETALKHAAVYLISFLNGQNAVLKDHCCWALGNMAANGLESQDMLHSAGILTQLSNIIMTTTHEANLMQSALFALANVIKNNDVCARFDDANAEFISRLFQLQHSWMTRGLGDGVTLDIARILFHLSARGEFHARLLAADVFTWLTEILMEYVRHTPEACIMVITPLVRCLGNLGSRPSDCVTMATQNGHLVGCLNKLLRINLTPFYFQKEALWTINNLTAHTPSVCRQCIECDLHLFLIERVLGQPADVQFESVLSLSHLLLHSSSAIFEQCIMAGLIQKLPALLKGSEEATMQTLHLCQLLLQYSPHVARQLDQETGLLENLNSLAFSSNPAIQQMAADLIEKYCNQ